MADSFHADGGLTVVRVTNFMKSDSKYSEPLGKVMREWRVTEPLPPRFQEGVWQRIQRAEARAAPAAAATVWSVFTAWLANTLPRPALAVAYVSVLLVLGMVGGYWQARQAAAHLNNELGGRYVQSVDPYQKSSRI